jgi:hypothetical protein
MLLMSDNIESKQITCPAIEIRYIGYRVRRMERADKLFVV